MKKSKWNKYELLNYGNILESKVISDDLNKYKIIVHDFQVLNNLLNSIGEKKKFGIDYSNPFKSFNININSKEIKYMINLNSLFIEDIPYTIFNFKYNDEKFKILFIDFLKNFDQELYEIYINLLKDKHISLVNNMYENGNVQHLITFNKYFINIKNNFLKYFSLIHEMGHIKQFLVCGEDMNKLEKLYKSLFIEIYSKYLELQWFEYLKNEGYTNFCLKWGEEFLIILSIYSEKIYSLYNNSNILEINNNHFLVNFMSYRYAMALKNKDNNVLEKVNNIICTNNNIDSFDKINSMLDEKEMYNNIKKFIDDYKNELNNKKKNKRYFR